MRKLILVVLATVVVVGGGALVANHYDKYQNKKQHDQVSAVETAKKAQYAADQSQFKLVADQNTQLRAECEKGLVAYGKLTPVVQKVTPAPVCGVQTVR